MIPDITERALRCTSQRKSSLLVGHKQLLLLVHKNEDKLDTCFIVFADSKENGGGILDECNPLKMCMYKQ